MGGSVTRRREVSSTVSGTSRHSSRADGAHVGKKHDVVTLYRRDALAVGVAALGVSVVARPGSVQAAVERPPPGFELLKDVLDGYSFWYPSDWLQVKAREHTRARVVVGRHLSHPLRFLQSAGADVFFRAPLKVDRNVFVEASSPSSKKFATVAEFAATPEAAGAKLVDQYLVEFASTRLGVRRDGSLVSAATRTGADGREYIDCTIQVSSYSVDQQYGVTVEERGPQKLEWCRLLQTTLGVANGRLYELRLQCAKDELEECRQTYDMMQQSFRVFDVL